MRRMSEINHSDSSAFLVHLISSPSMTSQINHQLCLTLSRNMLRPFFEVFGLDFTRAEEKLPSRLREIVHSFQAVGKHCARYQHLPIHTDAEACS